MSRETHELVLADLAEWMAKARRAEADYASVLRMLNAAADMQDAELKELLRRCRPYVDNHSEVQTEIRHTSTTWPRHPVEVNVSDPEPCDPRPNDAMRIVQAIDVILEGKSQTVEGRIAVESALDVEP